MPVDDASRAAATSTVLCLVDYEREQRGRAALTDSSLLSAAAAGHSDDMVATSASCRSAP